MCHIPSSGEVVKAAPQNAEQVLPSLIEAMRDKSAYVRSAARSALGQLSLEQLMEGLLGYAKSSTHPTYCN